MSVAPSDQPSWLFWLSYWLRLLHQYISDLHFFTGSKEVQLLLYFSSGRNRPDRLQHPIAMCIVIVMQIDCGINMTWDQLYTITHLQMHLCRFLALRPGQNAVLIPGWLVLYTRESFGFRHSTIGRK